MSGHTPGPWAIVEGSDPGMVSSWRIQIGTHQLPFFPYRRVYSECRSQSGLVSDPEMHANARLIIAAPRLLAALEAILENDGSRGTFDAFKLADARIEARAAIAEARRK